MLTGEKYDEKVDLWAIGILAFELHLSSSPFNIQSQEDLLKIVSFFSYSRLRMKFNTLRIIMLPRTLKNSLEPYLKKTPKKDFKRSSFYSSSSSEGIKICRLVENCVSDFSLFAFFLLYSQIKIKEIS